MIKKETDSSTESEKAINIFDSLLKDSGPKKLNESQIIIILDALANAGDAEMVARFPAILAICARKDLPLKFQSLFSRYWETSPKRQNLEKLLLASASIFELRGLQPPENLKEIAASLRLKYPDLLTRGEFQLSNGIHISLHNLQHALDSYAADRLKTQARQNKRRLPRTDTLDSYLDRLFSTKQRELVLKRRDGKAFTKTEREYFSRIVRKKLEAIANDEVIALARKLTDKSKIARPK